MKFSKVEAGWYATEDGKFAVVVECGGYSNTYDREVNGEGNDGWALCYSPGGALREDHHAGETLNWFDTKREAVEASDEYGGRAVREYEARLARLAEQAEPLTPADRDEVYVGLGDFDGGTD